MLYETDSYKTIIWDNTASAWQEYASASSPYDLDGTNSVSVRPLFHFDAGKINGVDTSGNPSDAASLTTAWKSLAGCNPDFDFDAQATTSKQPTWYSSGENSLPYVDFDGGDELYHKIAPDLRGPWIWMQVMQADGSNKWNGPMLKGDTVTYATGWNVFMQRTTNIAFYYSSSVIGGTYSWGYSDIIDLSAATRLLLCDNPNTVTGTKLQVDGDNAMQGGAASPSIPACVLPISGFGGGFSQSNTIGKVYEMALWRSGGGMSDTSALLSSADKNAIIAYVQTKYNLSGMTNY